MLRRWIRDQRGSNALEYGLIVGLVSLALAAGATAAGSSLGDMFNAITNEVGTMSAAISK
jgi:pilus assembly protein Flp/PilA